MTLANPKPMGWAYGELLTSTQMNSFGTQLPLAVDGSAGGSYSPSAVITLASKGLQVTGLFDAPGNSFYNVKRYNAVGDTTTDDTTALQAAEDAVAATTNGGDLFFPPGTYRITADLVKKHKVNWVAIPGTVTITMDHATENFLTFTGSAWTREATIHGINFEGTQSNAGTFCIETGTLHLLRFQYCNINKASALLAGRLFSAVSSSELVFEDCDIRAIKTNDNHFAHARLEFVRGVVTMAPAATSDLILAASELIVDGTEFVQVSTVGNVSFIDTNGGSVRIENAKFDVDDSGAGNSTYAVDVNGGTVCVGNCAFVNDVARYRLTTVAAAGSVLQLGPPANTGTRSSNFTLTNNVSGEYAVSTKATPPTLTMPSILFVGQTLDLLLLNNSGGNWVASAPIFAAGAGQSTPLVSYSAITDINYGSYMSARFVVMLSNTWVMVGAPVEI